ncbi:LOW QUALITY PROTEIN: Peptidase M10, metallopeptidase [Dillenia turbinata]|uniref:Peptidase M10, metallopeptidase n=1 Tax=Dillenia turbinata TaxID=194707 RepID=A0AAN8V2H7_9MAGN
MNSGESSSSPSSMKLHAVSHYSYFPGTPRRPSSKTDLTYAFLRSNQLSDSAKTVFANAFAKWSEVTPLTFTETESYYSADLRIAFYTGDYGDGEPFDGVLGTLAHTFSPTNGRFHLDGAENWVITEDVMESSSSTAVDLETVAVHEIGHFLGSLVDRRGDYVPDYLYKNKTLASDDIQGIQELYGNNPNYDGTETMTSQERDTSGGNGTHPLTLSWTLLAEKEIAMALTNPSFQFLCAIVFLLAFPNIIQSHSNQFEVIQKLEGYHKGQSSSEVLHLRQYLQKFGYLKHQNISLYKGEEFDEAVESAVKLYQQFYGLNVTGYLDSDTVNLMIRPRCGFPDIIDHEHTHYNFSPSFTFLPDNPRWSNGHYNLRYRFLSSTLYILSDIFRRAFDQWAKVSLFRFQEITDNSNTEIQIGFYTRDHGDGSPFDGPWGTLAHAFWPEDGRLHFDADESWSVADPIRADKFDLESVAVHEIGHILGLGHSTDPNAVMYPTTTVGVAKRELSDDDVKGIRSLYGW